MSRIHTVTRDTATAEQNALFDAIQAQLGVVPNFLKIFANSPAALRAFLHQFDYEGKDHDVVFAPDPKVVRRAKYTVGD